MHSNDILGKALLDYQSGRYSTDIQTFSSLNEEDLLPLPYLFRDYSEMPILEQKALQMCQGAVLDIGAGAGSHSLYLQERNIEVTALDSSQGAIKTCQHRGIDKVVCSPIEEYAGDTYDTLLLLMNGLGLAGTLANLAPFISHLKTLLKPNGQIILDSSDIIYMFDMDERITKSHCNWIETPKDYYGNVQFKMSYKGLKSDSFSWLYIDFNTLKKVVHQQGLQCEMIYEGEHYDYLAKLTAKK